MTVARWQTSFATRRKDNVLPEFVIALLTPEVTAALPNAWQGEYTIERARAWIEERDLEGTNLLVLDRDSASPVGLLILADADWPDIHIGFLLLQSEWGKGLASELVEGLVTWCQASGVRCIRGGVAEDNFASQRVLEKLGFRTCESQPDSTERFYELLLHN